MRIIQSALSISLLFLTTINFAQESGEKNITLSEAQVFFGAQISDYRSLNLVEMQKFAPSSSILARDFTGFSQSGYGYLNSSQLLAASLGLSFKNLPYMTLRLGLNYSDRNSFYGSLSKSETGRYDTLTSSATGQQYFQDTTRFSMAYFNHSSQIISFDASILFRTNPEKRWSIYGGVGYTAGIGFNSFSSIGYSEYTYGQNYGYGGESPNAVSINETFKNKSYFTHTIYLPMGVDFRIGKKREFWNRLHLFYEIKPSITFNHIPELGTSTHLGIGHGLGIRVKW
ncbi:MAG: hypothetical protein V4638_01650 [Bacteroidota bacterium]